MLKKRSEKICILLLITVYLALSYMWLNYRGISCVFLDRFGVVCPGCGMTRAFLSVLKLDFYRAAKYNVVTESCAARHKFTPLYDSLPTMGVGGEGYSRVVTIPKIKIGKITIKHPTFIVVPDESIPADSLGGFKLEYVLGTECMEALGEVVFDMDKDSMTVPSITTPKGENTTPLTHSNNYYIYPTVNGRQISMQFDTGAVATHLYGRFMREFREVLTLIGEPKSTRARGFGGTTYYTVQCAQKIDITMGNKSITLNNVDVSTADHDLPIQKEEYGSLGTDVLLKCKRVRINFKQMFVDVQ